jgi:hypothetical protein
MRNDFAIFILTHGRPDRVYTLQTLSKSGYTGRVYLVIDDADKAGDEYRRRYGDQVLVFSKDEISKTFDQGDNFTDKRTIVYARNACFQLAQQVGITYFMQLDDDYMGFEYTVNSSLQWKYRKVKTKFDDILEAMIAFYAGVPQIATLAMSQGGDFIGGRDSFDELTLRRKAMNSFLCSVERPFKFVGRINEDVNTYTAQARAGLLMLSLLSIKLVQRQTQSNAGGMSDVYLNNGTYVKSFYTVMYAPSCTTIADIGDPRSPHYRIHHAINWATAVPKLMSEAHRKAGHHGR